MTVDRDGVSTAQGVKAVRAGGAAWTSTVLYFLAEFVTALAWPTSYSVSADSISNLGATGCGGAERSGIAEICSPLHAVMNLAFVITGLLVIAGAVGLRRLVAPGRVRLTALVLLVVAGLSTAATGLAPVNVDEGMHLLVTTPTFVARNAAMALVAVALPYRWRTFGFWTALCCAAGTLGTMSILVPGAPFGITERASLYPFLVWSVTAGIAALVASTRPADPTDAASL